MPRTTLNIEGPILGELKHLQNKQGKSLGELVSELLAEALARRRRGKRERQRFKWNTSRMEPLLDISDKDALYAVLDTPDRR